MNKQHMFKGLLGKYKGVTLVGTEKELGYGKGRNYRVCLFGKYKANPYVIFLNNDFNYIALSKTNFENEEDALDYYNRCLKDMDMRVILKKAKARKA